MKLVKEILYEKFTDDDSDPIRDMGIGIYGKLKRAKEDLQTASNQIKSEYFFEDNRFMNAASIVYEMIKIFLGPTYPRMTAKNINKMLDKYEKSHYLSAFGSKIIREYFEKEFYVKFNINEKFTDDSDPIHDMGIGVVTKINKIKKQMKGYWRGHEDIDIARYCISEVNDIDDVILILDYLLNNGLKIYKNQNQYGYSENLFEYALLNCIGEKRDKILKLFLDKGYKIMSPDLSAVLRKDLKVDDQLLRNIFDVADTKLYNPSLLNNAALRNNTYVMKKLIDSGVDPTTKNYYALQQAIKHKNTEIIKILIKYLKKDLDV